MVPNSWVSCHLGDFMDFKNGLNADKSQYGYGLKFVNVMDVFGNDILTEDKIIGRVNVAESQLEGNLLKFGDVLFNRTSETFDEIAMSAVYLDDKPAVFGGFVIRARPSNGVLAPAYSVYLFQSSRFRNQVIKLGQGAVRANIGQKDLAKVKVSLPPLPEQKKIAQILSTWDKAITTTEQLLANSQQQKKALMQQLLTGKKRLLDDNGVRFSGEWKHGYLSDIAKIAKGKALSSRNLTEGSYPVIAGGKTSPYSHSEFTHENIITVSASGAYAGYVAYHPHKIWASDCSAVAAKKNSSTLFIFQLLTHLQNKIYSLQSGGAQPHIYPKDLDTLKVFIPAAAEQQKIAAVLSSADQEIDSLQQKIEALKQEKKALMQQLLTGKRRVKLN
ncbi:MAG: restriction endonuclease subunit S [Thiopseudomonas sp.]|nr:restriction endonuclease subunit S [Thiopseudomonas sp.]MCK9466529.1 restriction endonuclease subunit S [Thiopseudomonas sp.]